MIPVQKMNSVLFLIPLGDNDTYPTSPAGPTMFGYKGTEHEELVKRFFNFDRNN